MKNKTRRQQPGGNGTAVAPRNTAPRVIASSRREAPVEDSADCEVDSVSAESPADDAAPGPAAVSGPDSLVEKLKGELAIQRKFLQRMAEALRSDVQRMAGKINESQSEAAVAQAELIQELGHSLKQSVCSGGTPSVSLSGEISDLRQSLREIVSDVVAEHLGSSPKPESCPKPAESHSPKTPPHAAEPQELHTGSWAEIRASMLCDDNDDEVRKPGVGDTQCGLEASLADPTSMTLLEAELELEVTELTDLGKMSEVELRAALVERDCLVSTLVSRLRRIKDSAVPAFSVDELQALHEEVPEDLSDRIHQTLDRMDEQIRLGELELSLERARLSRQRAELDESRRSLEFEARQMGLERRADGTFIADQDRSRRRKPRRWLGRLGMGD